MFITKGGNLLDVYGDIYTIKEFNRKLSMYGAAPAIPWRIDPPHSAKCRNKNAKCRTWRIHPLYLGSEIPLLWP